MTLTVRPSRLSFAAGLAVIALWALLWVWFLLGIVRGPEKHARQPGEIPALASRVEAFPAHRATVPS